MRTMYQDKITLIKSTGEKFTDILANVQRDKIFIQDGNIPVEEGDIIERKLPSGVTEKKRVLDPGFYAAALNNPRFPAYQVQVENYNQPKSKTTPTIYHIQDSPNARINIQSQDFSSNCYQTSTLELFEEIERTFKINNLSNDAYKLLIELKSSVDTPQYNKNYQTFISSLADHITILSPFIPALTQLIRA